MAARTASREEIQAHVTPALSPRIIGNHLLATGLRSHVPLVRLTLKTRQRQARLLWYRERVDWRVKWHSVVFTDESRLCPYSSDRRTRVQRRPGERHLPECIRPQHTGPTSGFMVRRAISYNSRSHLVFLQGKVNRARYIAQVVNPVLLPFLRQEGNVLFQQETLVHIRLLGWNVFFMVYNKCPGQQKPQISRQLNTYGT